MIFDRKISYRILFMKKFTMLSPLCDLVASSDSLSYTVCIAHCSMISCCCVFVVVAVVVENCSAIIRGSEM